MLDMRQDRCYNGSGSKQLCIKIINYADINTREVSCSINKVTFLSNDKKWSHFCFVSASSHFALARTHLSLGNASKLFLQTEARKCGCDIFCFFEGFNLIFDN